jgi:hypothetical protein
MIAYHISRAIYGIGNYSYIHLLTVPIVPVSKLYSLSVHSFLEGILTDFLTKPQIERSLGNSDAPFFGEIYPNDFNLVSDSINPD